MRLNWLPGATQSRPALNSGAGAILLAQYLGAAKVLLLGYDCRPMPGLSHCHGDHPEPLRNSANFDRWRTEFASIARQYGNIINCTGSTALSCFSRMSIDDGLRFRF